MPDPQKKDWFSQFEEPKSDYFNQFEELPKAPEAPQEKGFIDKAFDFGKSAIAGTEKFIGDHPVARRFFSGPSEEDLGGRKLTAETTAPGEIPGLRSATGYLRNKMINSGDYATGFLGGLADEWAPGITEGAFDPGNAGIKMGDIPRPPVLQGVPVEEGLNTAGLPSRERGLLAPPSPKLLEQGPIHVSPVEEIQLPNTRVRMDTGRFARGAGIIKTGGEAGVNVDREVVPRISMRESLSMKGESPKIELPKHEPINAEGFTTVKDDAKLEPQIKEAEIVSEVPKSPIEQAQAPEAIPTVKLRGPAEEYINAVKSGQIDRSTSFSDFQKNSLLGKGVELGKRLIKEEEGTFDPYKMFKKIKGVDEGEANKVRESIIDSLIQGGRLDLEGIYGKTVGMNRKQFNKIVDEIIDTGAAGKVAEQIKINTPQPIQKLLGALNEAKINSALQAAQLSAERSQRFGAFGKALAEGEGKEGFFKAASKMAGDYTKVSPVEFKLGQADTDALFNQIKNNTRISQAEKLRAGFAMRDLLEGNRVLQRNELMLMDRIFGPGVGNQIMLMHGGLGGIPIKLAKTANTMKSMQATLDLSAPFRQGLGLVHRKEFWNAYIQMFKYARSEDAFQALEKAMEAHPNYLLSRDAGLFTADHSLANHEEAWMDSYLNDVHKALGDKARYSPARASERAYVGFLNKLRFDTFNSLLEKAEKGGLETFKVSNGEKIPTDLTNQIAKYINTSTGRGDLGRFSKYGEDLNTVLFSPRLIASRLTILNPKYYIDANPFVRKEALKTLLALGGFVGITNELGKYAFGAETKLAPTTSNLTNPDYGKMKFGKTRLDPGAGLNQYIVAASQFVTGKATSSTGDGTPYDLGKYGQPGRVGKLIGVGNPRYNSFLENKFSPLANLIDTIVSGKTDPATRKPYNISTEISKKFAPLLIQDLIDLSKEHPDLLGAGLGALASQGMGLQTYGGSTPSSMSIGKPTMGNLKP